MSLLDLVKDKRQNLIVDRWAEAGYKGVFQAVTGFGKTRVLMLAAQNRLKRDPNSTIIAIVPSTNLYNQFTEIIANLKLPNFEVYVINTAIQKNLKCSLLLLDEIHCYTSTEFGKIFEVVTYDEILGCTATLDKDKIVYINQYCPLVDIVTLKECLQNGWVSPFQIYNLAVPLTPEEDARYKEITKRYNKFFSVFLHDFKTAMACLKVPEARLRVAQRTGYAEKDVFIHALNWNRAMQERKDLLYNCSNKLTLTAEIINRFPELQRILTFSMTIDFTERLTSLLPNSASYHGKIPSKLRKKILQSFKDGNTRILNTAKALDVGEDIPELDFSVVCSGTSKPIQALQRLGRSLRVQKDKFSREINLYVKDSQEEKWLRQRQKESANIKYITSIDEIV